MPLRRALYSARFVAAIVLPLWLLVGRGIIVGDSGWEFVLLIVACPVLAIAMAAVAGLSWARQSVRQSKAVSWLDAGVVGAWYVSIILAGFLAHEATAVLVVVLSVAAFWSAAWQLYDETRKRVKSALDGLEFAAAPAQQYRATRMHPGGEPGPEAPGAGQVIRLEPPREQD
jgi:hypothetical protein